MSSFNEPRLRSLCCFIEYLVDQRIYYYELLHTTVSLACIVILNVSIDSTYINYLQHVLRSFRLVDYYLQNASNIKQNENASMDRESEVHDLVLKAIAMHKKSIQYADQLKDAYHVYFPFNAGTTLMAITLLNVVFVLSKGSKDMSKICGLMFLWVGVINLLAYESWIAQQFIDNNLEIQDVVFQTSVPIE